MAQFVSNMSKTLTHIGKWVHDKVATPVEAIDHFVPDEYLGEWVELYRKPNRFQDGSRATAIYTRTDDGSVQVTNLQASGSIVGRADIATEFNTNGAQKGTLWVSFSKWFRAPYWIVFALKKDNRYVVSVVSDPLRSTFWTLVRKDHVLTLDDHAQLGAFLMQFNGNHVF